MIKVDISIEWHKLHYCNPVATIIYTDTECVATQLTEIFCTVLTDIWYKVLPVCTTRQQKSIVQSTFILIWLPSIILHCFCWRNKTLFLQFSCFSLENSKVAAAFNTVPKCFDEWTNRNLKRQQIIISFYRLSANRQHLIY